MRWSSKIHEQRNVQLSLFPLIPALLPIIYNTSTNSEGFLDLFCNFGAWARATVVIQVFSGLITAVVIKYSDNILKGFATSLSIVISFLTSIALFDFHITPTFLIGASTVLSATWGYNQPPGKDPIIVISPSNGKPVPMLSTPVGTDDPILGQVGRKKSTPTFGGSSRVITSALGINVEQANGNHGLGAHFGETRYNQAPYGSPYTSRTPSRVPSPLPSPGSGHSP